MKLDQLKVRGEANGKASIDENTVTLTANAETDWFHHPADEFRRNDVISVVTQIESEVFSIQARVSVNFNSAYDAGAIFIQVDDENWAKLAFEYSAAAKPTIVSVITRTTSDDADGPNFLAESVWLRVYSDGKTVAYHFSKDGKYWNFLRWFAIPNVGKRPLTVGFGAQAPTGTGCTARFSDIKLSYDRIENLRNGS